MWKGQVSSAESIKCFGTVSPYSQHKPKVNSSIRKPVPSALVSELNFLIILRIEVLY